MIGEIVSIVVISYNSSGTIIETLDSAYAQDYKWIELIITDDCSSDGTIERIEQWTKEHKARFVDVKKIYHSNNNGVTVNANDGIKMASGKWVKCIAADDKLRKDCISNNLKYVTSNNAQIVFSNMHYCVGDKVIQNFEISLNRKLEKFSKKTAKEQYKFLLRENCLPAPTAFFSKKLFDEVDGFDEDIKMMEDWPFWLNVTKKGVTIHYNSVFSVNYRLAPNSISHSNRFHHVQHQVKIKYCYDNIPKYHILYYYHEKLLMKKCQMQDNLQTGTSKYKMLELMYAVLWPPRFIELVKSYL